MSHKQARSHLNMWLAAHTHHMYTTYRYTPQTLYHHHIYGKVHRDIHVRHYITSTPIEKYERYTPQTLYHHHIYGKVHRDIHVRHYITSTPIEKYERYTPQTVYRHHIYGKVHRDIHLRPYITTTSIEKYVEIYTSGPISSPY
jgi:hypothetical protein